MTHWKLQQKFSVEIKFLQCIVIVYDDFFSFCSDCVFEFILFSTLFPSLLDWYDVRLWLKICPINIDIYIHDCTKCRVWCFLSHLFGSYSGFGLVDVSIQLQPMQFNSIVNWNEMNTEHWTGGAWCGIADIINYYVYCNFFFPIHFQDFFVKASKRQWQPGKMRQYRGRAREIKNRRKKIECVRKIHSKIIEWIRPQHTSNRRIEHKMHRNHVFRISNDAKQLQYLVYSTILSTSVDSATMH